MKFEGAGFEVTEGTSNKPGKSIKPGVEQAKISSIEYFESSQKKTPGLRMILETKPVDGLTDENNNPMGQKATATMWLSEGAWDIDGANWCTKARLTILADKLGLTKEFDAISSDSAEGFVNEVAKLFVGKAARFAFGGEWQTFEGDNGTIKFIRPSLLTFGFVESLKDVPNDEDTKLKVDVDNPNHVKPLEVADDMSEDNVETTVDTTEDSPW